MKRTNRDASVTQSCRAAPAHAHTGEGNQDAGVTEMPTTARSRGGERGRPLRPELDRAALDPIRRRGPEILGTARRYAANLDDADDAYQRGLEILLRKAPSTSEEDLVPWLKTVVKHEAFALRRHRERHAPVTDDGELAERGTRADATHDQACRYELLRQGAEAMRQLKPQEVRALWLRAEGYSYAEICRTTGWTYTKVNRCLTEGRRALAIRLAGIEGGIECARLAPLLSALADGDAPSGEVAQLQLHMRSCLTCRAYLRLLRAAGGRSAGIGASSLKSSPCRAVAASPRTPIGAASRSR
jgi:RNA polymerase sigma factor (sigma-70 family)